MARDPNLDEEGLALHVRLLSGDRTATAEIAERYYQRIVAIMHKRHKWRPDPDVIDEATSDAFVSYFTNPLQFNPEKRSLAGFLQMAAEGDVRNAIARELRHRDHLQPDVALPAGDVEYENEPAARVNVEEEVVENLHPIWEQIDALVHDPLDRQVVRWMMDGERETPAFADLLGITHLPKHEQEREVKKCKDRLVKKIKRNLDPKEVRYDDRTRI